MIPGEGAPLLTLDHIRGFLEGFAQQTLRIEFYMQIGRSWRIRSQMLRRYGS